MPYEASACPSVRPAASPLTSFLLCACHTHYQEQLLPALLLPSAGQGQGNRDALTAIPPGSWGDAYS